MSSQTRRTTTGGGVVTTSTSAPATTQNTTTGAASNTNIPDHVMQSDAMAKPVSFYDKKAKEVHAAMRDIFDERIPFLEVAKKYNFKPENLAVAFAVFGVQAMEIVNTRDIVRLRSPELKSLLTMSSSTRLLTVSWL